MKQAIWCLLILTFSAVACKKLILESQQIDNYIEDNNLSLIETDTGLLYEIYEEGVGDYPTDSSIVTVKYTGSFLEGGVFEGPVTSSIDLSFTIEGWQEGVPLLKRGGSAFFLIPSDLAYGSVGRSPNIPPNTPLIFELELIDF